MTVSTGSVSVVKTVFVSETVTAGGVETSVNVVNSVKVLLLQSVADEYHPMRHRGMIGK